MERHDAYGNIPGVQKYQHFSFHTCSFYFNLLLRRLPTKDAVGIAKCLAYGKLKEARKIVVNHLNQQGLIGLTKYYLDYSAKQICRVFEILAAEDQYPVLIHCTHGKDRTGLIVILIYRLVGATVDAIKDDYMASDLFMKGAKSGEELHRYGFSEEFKCCSEPLVNDVCDYISEKYGSVHQYLLQNGLPEGCIQRVKDNILENNGGSLNADGP